MALDVSRVRGRLGSWWWDLPLRWKGFIVVVFPTLALVPSIVGVALLNDQQDGVRAEARVAREAQVLSLVVQHQLVDLANAVLGYAATGDRALLDGSIFVRAELDRDADALLALPDGDVAPLADDAVRSARGVLDELDQLRRAVEEGTSDLDDLRAGLLVVQDRSATARSRFDALDAQLAAHASRARERVDDRSVEIIVALLAGVLAAGVVAWIAVWLFTRGIVKRVAEVGAVAGRVIDGEKVINIEEPARDEIGMLFAQLRRAGELLILQNVELEKSRDAERDRVDQERLMRDVVRRVHEAVGQHEVLAATVRELGPATDSDRVLVVSVEDGGIGTVLAEWNVEGLGGLGVGRRLPSDEQRDANFALVVRQRHAFAVDDIATSELLPQTRELLGQLGIGSMLVAPVVADDEPLAALVLVTSGRARPWPAGSELLTEVIAGEVATALTHARLYEREREMVQRLRELDQAKSDFVASVSHDLRTPLTSIRGYVEMLCDGEGGPLHPDQEHMLKIVERNADRLLALIEDLLTLARIESGTFRVARAPVALDDVVHTTLAELRAPAIARGVVLEADFAPDIPAVVGDASQLERVLLNLLSNAIKFTTDGGRVVVRLRRSGGTVELVVEDEGIGIPESEQDRLFSRFFRSSTSQERAIQGTGLGLVIVKNIVEHHGGDIAVKSWPDVGTAFTIRLPVAAAPVTV